MSSLAKDTATGVEQVEGSESEFTATVTKESARIRKDFMTLAGTVEQRIKELDEKEKYWRALSQVMEENAAKAPTKVILDIGNSIFFLK
jgi:thiamine biosynthesis lipoprotein ApbE